MMLAELPDEVIEAIEDFEITHSVDRDRLLGLATIALAGRTDLLGEAWPARAAVPQVFPPNTLRPEGYYAAGNQKSTSQFEKKSMELTMRKGASK